MSAQAILLWFVNMLVDTGGQLSFKKAAAHDGRSDGLAHWKHMLARPWIWIGICCYLGEFLVWTAFLSLVDLSVGVMLGSINIVVIMLAGRVLFGEKLTPRRTAGILLITLGVAVVGLGQSFNPLQVP
ncbi:MAG: DMT family transporter [Desulfovibrio sp.]|jgi:drug/metabolite transporter (DMT)-like permease|nr:DMT family transporter [Desulfovibrio sp.]